MTKCVQCNQPIDAGQTYIEVRKMPDAENPGGAFDHYAHWPTCRVDPVVSE